MAAFPQPARLGLSLPELPASEGVRCSFTPFP